MNALKSILVGIDFSPGSAAALRQAIRIARCNGASLHPVYFIDTNVITALDQPFAPPLHGIHTGLHAEAQAGWESFRSGIDGAGELALTVEIDHPVRAAVRNIRRYAADLLVLGSHGAGESPHGPGTFAAACVRKANTRVLLVREPHTGPYRKVLACVDFSATSRMAVEEAARMARQDAAELHVLHVFSGPWHVFHYRAPTPEAAPHFRQQYADVLRRRLEAFVAESATPTAGLPTHTHLVDHPQHGTAIARFAAHHGMELVVLGTRGSTRLRDLLMGSTAERVLRDAPCSVLALKPSGFVSPIRDDAAHTDQGTAHTDPGTGSAPANKPGDPS